jgi:hypothetical protein
MIPPAILKISPNSQSTINIPAIVHNISNISFPVEYLVKVYPYGNFIKQVHHNVCQ